jgi:hypothetical protein
MPNCERVQSFTGVVVIMKIVKEITVESSAYVYGLGDDGKIYWAWEHTSKNTPEWMEFEIDIVGMKKIVKTFGPLMAFL